MKPWTTGLDTWPKPRIFDTESDLKSRTRDSVSRLGSAPGTGTPGPELRWKPESVPTTFLEIINVFYFDHNGCTKTMLWETTVQDCCVWKNISCFRFWRKTDFLYMHFAVDHMLSILKYDLEKRKMPCQPKYWIQNTTVKMYVCM